MNGGNYHLDVSLDSCALSDFLLYHENLPIASIIV